MKYKLIINDPMTLDELIVKVSQGAKFKVYPYCISLFFAVTLKRLSPAVFINTIEREKKYIKKYNRISLLFGVWGIPWGIHYTINYLRLNNKGGIDVTNDIMLNLDHESLASKLVNLRISSMVFAHPEKDITNTFLKVFEKYGQKNILLNRIIVGRHLNVNFDDDYHYVIGVLLKTETHNHDYELLKIKEQVTNALYREFSKRITFEIVDLHLENDLIIFLKEQGKEYFKR